MIGRDGANVDIVLQTQDQCVDVSKSGITPSWQSHHHGVRPHIRKASGTCLQTVLLDRCSLSSIIAQCA